MIGILFRRLFTQVSGNFRLRTRCRLILLMAVVALLGVWSASPALAASSSQARDHRLILNPISIAPGPEMSLPEPDDGSLPGSMSHDESLGLLLPDLRTLPPYDLDIVTLPDGSRELRLSNTIWNSGAGPLELEGEFNSETRKTRVVQHVFGQADTQFDRLVGEFIWHAGHDHWHFEEFSIYELWTLSPSGGLDELVSSSGKLSYCVIDTDIIDSEHEGFSPLKRYRGCGHTLQGLSVGWGDTYKSFLDGQSIQLGAVRDGYYALKSTANPDGILLEANYQNNTALIYLDIRGEEVELLDLDEYFERRCQESEGLIAPEVFCEV